MTMAVKYALAKRAKKMAKGGDVKGVHESGSSGIHQSTAGDFARVGTSLHRKGDRARVYGETHAGEGALNKSKELHSEKLAEMRGMKKPNLYADGGMVERIMAKRANPRNDTPPMTDFEDNDFDDLALRDDLEQHYTGANSGDELGNATVEDEERDVVARIMRSRAKKDRLPRPA